MKSKTVGTAILFSLTCAACGSEKKSTIGPAGGTVSKDGASLVVPEGALDSDVEVEVQRVPSVNAELDDDKRLAGEPYAFTPHGTQFKKPVELTIPVSGDASGVSKLDDDKDESWEGVNGVAPANRQATFETTSFSIYVGTKAAPTCPATEPSLGDSCDIDVPCEYGSTTCTCEFGLWACL